MSELAMKEGKLANINQRNQVVAGLDASFGPMRFGKIWRL
jgi:hypothetical protein